MGELGENAKYEGTSLRKRKRIALDFDGVLHGYSKKWHDGTIYDGPVDGAVEAVRELQKDYDLVVFTCREPIEDIEHWLAQHFQTYIPVTNGKPHADIYIDDRGYHFEGSWKEALEEIQKRADEKWTCWNHKDTQVKETFKREDGRYDKWS